MAQEGHWEHTQSQPGLPCAEEGESLTIPCPTSLTTHLPRDRPALGQPYGAEAYLLPLHWGQRGRDAHRPAGVQAILGQGEGLLHAEAGEGCVQVAAVQAHGRGHGALNGAAAPLPGVFPAVSIGSFVPEKEGRALRGDPWHLLNDKGVLTTCQTLHSEYCISLFIVPWRSVSLPSLFSEAQVKCSPVG